jgi:hypothetical protein
MTVPFTQYLESKDNYCLGYFGDDKDFLDTIFKAREWIEKELPGLRVFIACKEGSGRDVILESKMADYKGKMAYFCKLEEKYDLMGLLSESKIPIPEKN